jgi:hypothetical protein
LACQADFAFPNHGRGEDPDVTAGKQKRIFLSLGPGTLPSQGGDRLDFTSYNARQSGRPPLTGREMIAALPEINTIAEIVFDDDGPHPQGTHEDIRKLARFTG